MKLMIALLTLLFFYRAANGQAETDTGPERKNIVTATPFGFVNKLKIKYERALTQKASVGGAGAVYYGFYPGFQIAPFGRYYLSDEVFRGLYGQVQAAFYSHNYRIENAENITRTQSFSGIGGGIGLGYQFLLGNRDHVVIDLMGGCKYYPKEKYDPEESDLIELWYFTGPGSYFNGTIAVGLAF